MSRAFARFTFDDGEILNGIYDGTSDIMCGFMSSDQRESWDWYYHRQVRGPREYLAESS